MKTEPELQAYFAEAASWDLDRLQQAQRLGRMGWGTAIAGWTAVVALGVGLLMLLPLKTVEPFIVRVDNTTGIVDVVPRYTGAGVQDEAITRYLLGRYVRICEAFVMATAESDYEECGAFHTARVNEAWYAKWKPSNPSSPLVRFRDGTTVRVSVAAITFLERGPGLRDLAQVRYRTATRAGGAGSDRIEQWIATIRFTYGAPSGNAKLRQWNPMGLKIVDFRREPELAVSGSAASVNAP